MADLAETIEQNARGPAEAKGDAVSMKQHSLPDQIETDKYLAGKRATANPAKAFARAKIVPPGTTPSGTTRALATSRRMIYTAADGKAS